MIFTVWLSTLRPLNVPWRARINQQENNNNDTFNFDNCKNKSIPPMAIIVIKPYVREHYVQKQFGPLCLTHFVQQIMLSDQFCPTNYHVRPICPSRSVEQNGALKLCEVAV